MRRSLTLSRRGIAASAAFAAFRVLAAASLFLAAGCVSPEAMLKLEAELAQAADAVNELRINSSIMQTTLDSLTVVVAKQDSTIFRLANATGVQVVK
jgi:hypothetical protein